MRASAYGNLETVRTLLEHDAEVNAKDNVRNQIEFVMIMTILIVLIIKVEIMIIINNKGRDDKRQL